MGLQRRLHWSLRRLLDVPLLPGQRYLYWNLHRPRAHPANVWIQRNRMLLTYRHHRKQAHHSWPALFISASRSEICGLHALIDVSPEKANFEY